MTCGPHGCAWVALFRRQNAWGGENTFLYILREAFGLRAYNPCLSLRVVHMHCALPTAFGVHVVGDKRLGKREISSRVQAT